MQDYNQAATYVHALTGQPADVAIIDIRLIHDVQKDIPAHHYRGTLPQLWETIVAYQSHGYGTYINLNALDGNGRELANVQYIRAHVVDLDNLSADANLARACQHQPLPSIVVHTSPGKHHVYWIVAPYTGNEYFTALQRRLRQLYDGDKSVIDASRVLRLPGTLHLKRPDAPHLVTWQPLGGYGHPIDVQTLSASVAHVNVIDGGGSRHALGDPALAAPSLDWLRFGLSLIDPNMLDRGEWISLTAAIKQAGWTLADEPTLRAVWDEWCARYTGNDPGENDKQWQSIRETEVGWNSIRRRAPTLGAYEQFGFKDRAPEPLPQSPQTQQQPTQDTPSDPSTMGEILDEQGCKIWFKDCYFIERLGEILTPTGRFMNSTQFNGTYGGKHFIITSTGKITDEAWKAALRSTVWTIPKVDHVRFTPDAAPFSIVEDEMGRKGVNTYVPVRMRAVAGDVTPFLQHMERLLPVESDRHILYEYLAHNVKFPGHKIPWAPMVQSVEGTGKGFIREMMQRILGTMYCYTPKAPELIKSGSTFNAWMRRRLMIIVDEIKIDERRELIEIMKPWISDSPIEIQAKGVDQDLEDNPANWLFFSNYKDAIPVNQNGRRYAIFYSQLQSKADLAKLGMVDNYFPNLFNWLRMGGSEAIAYWLLNYPIERGAIPMRAPDTSSSAEALRVSRGPVEVAIANAIVDGLPGFRGGYVSVQAAMNRLRAVGGRLPTVRTVEIVLEQMGYHNAGRAARQYGQESMVERPHVFTIMPGMPIDLYGRMQGYE